VEVIHAPTGKVTANDSYFHIKKKFYIKGPILKETKWSNQC